MANSELKTLVEIFNNSFFRIPDYQRGYAWKEEQLEDFWDDLDNLRDEAAHYTGLLTIEPVKKESIAHSDKWLDDMWLFEKGFKSYYVIDGQQRLTTVIILIQSLLDRFEDDATINFEEKKDLVKKFLYQQSGKYKSFIFGYEKDNPSDEFFKTKVLEQSSLGADKYPEETLYTSNLLGAKSYFQAKVKSMEQAQLETLIKKVINNLKFNVYEIDNDLDVFVTFETMNNRGKPLSKLELLKNRLIYLSTLLDDEDGNKLKLRKDINEVWKTVYEYLGKNKLNPLDDDGFLKHHWIMFYKYDRSKSDAYADYLLNEQFTAKRVNRPGNKEPIKFEDIKDYIDSLSVSVKMWFYIFNPSYSPYNADVKKWLERMNRLGFGAFSPLLMAVMIKNKDEIQLCELLQAMERFQFLVFRISRRQANTMNSHFYRVANEYYYGNEGFATVSEVDENIRWLTDGEDEDNYYGWYDFGKFEDYTGELFKKENGFYSWNGLKYFLYEYESHLHNQSLQGEMKLSWDTVRNSDTIEHIYPQDASLDGWKQRFGHLKPSQRRLLLHSLGNLVLISHSKNSSLQNQTFDHKKKHKSNRTGNDEGFFNGSYSEIEVSQYADWRPQDIAARGIKLLEFMEKRWNIEIDNKDDLLQLAFVSKQQHA